jgi:tetratricopeptide (TPR) repeat protein
MSVVSAGPDPHRVFDMGDLARELDLLRRRAALGSRKARISLADLAKLVELPRSTLHTYLSGLTLAAAEVLDRIVIALGASPVEQAQWSEAWYRVSAHQHVERRAASARVPRQLPADTVAFTGREEALVELDDLLDTGGTVVISAIAGTAGVGKTALAVHWGHRVADRFPDGQLYVNLRGYDPGEPVRPALALGGFLRALGVPEGEVPQDTAEAAALYRTLLAERRMLVVLDNARSPEQVRDLLPGTAQSFVLVTSRDALGGLVVRDGARRVVLDLMRPTESIALLRSLIGERVDAEPDVARLLAEQCARLPLALRIAAEIVRNRPDAKLAEVLDDLRDERRRLDLLDVDGDARTAVRAVFCWSYRQLPDDDARLFRLLGVQPGQDIGELAAAALLGTGVPEVLDALERLTRAHLVDRTPDGRYSMHDLLRTYAAELAAMNPAELRTALTRLFDHYRHGAAVAMDELYPTERDHRPRIEAPRWTPPADARSWLDGELRNLLAAVGHTAAHGWPAHATDLATTLWRHLDTGSHNSEGLVAHRAALRAARELRDQSAEADALSHLGMVHRAAGEYAESLDCAQRALAIRQALGDSAGEVHELNSLGMVYDCLGRYADSVDQHQRAILIRRRLGDVRGEGVNLLNLGVTQVITGSYDDAESGLRRALRIFREVGDQLGEAHALCNLGRVHQRQHRTVQAMDLHRQALAAYRERGSRYGEAFALNNLGIGHRELGDHDDAVSHHQQALDLAIDIDERGLQLEVFNDFGVTLLAVGRIEESRSRHEAARVLAAKGDHKYDHACALRGIADALCALGDPDQARAHWELALEAFTELGVPQAEEMRQVVIGRTGRAAHGSRHPVPPRP